MFDFEKLDVYLEARLLHKEAMKLMKTLPYIDSVVRNQLKRASLSIALNIAEGSGKNSGPSKRNFYNISRGSVYECVAIFDILKDDENVSQNIFESFYKKYERISKMLLGLIRSIPK